MLLFTRSKENFLKKFLEIPNGVLSKVTIIRVFSAIDSEQFESCFMEWVHSIATITKGQIIAIDVNKIRNAKSHGKNRQFIWLVLGPVKQPSFRSNYSS